MANRRNASHPTVTSEAQPQHSSEQIAIRNLWNDHELYENYPKFQRLFVWPLKFKRALIDSILRGAPVAALFAYKARNEAGEEKYWILDGHQRLSTIYDFLRGNLITWTIAQAHHEEPNSLPPIEPGRRFHELTERSRNLFHAYKFTVDIIEYEDEAQLGMYYRRIQHHLPLKTGEKLASYESDAIKYANQLKQHPIWEPDIYKGNTNRNEPLAGSLALLSTQMRQGCTAITSSALHRVASGTNDAYMTEKLYDTVESRLDVTVHVFDGIIATHPIEVVLMYQAVMFLENHGVTLGNQSDRGCLTDWFGELQAEGLRVGRRGYSYALGDKLRDVTQQEDFWQKNLPAVIDICEKSPGSAA